MHEGRRLWDNLYDDAERYWYNIPFIMAQNRIFCPDYVQRFYVTQNVLDHDLGEIFHKAVDLEGIEVVPIDCEYEYREPVINRFLPLWEDWDIVLLRDIDSILTGGEWKCNKVFEKEEEAYVYSARSHKEHWGMLAGLCGFRPKMIKDRISNNVEEFVQKYTHDGEVSVNDLDQRLLNRAFTRDHEFTIQHYYDMPIHHARKNHPWHRFPSKKVSIDEICSHKLYGVLDEIYENIIERYIKGNWGGKPVDCRGSLTQEILEYDDDLKKIITSSDTLSSFYTSQMATEEVIIMTSNKVPTIYRNPHSHKGDTSRELLSMWDEQGYCKLKDCSSTLSWWNEVGDVLLYEFNQEPNVPVPHKNDVNLGLFGNYKPSDWGLHWIFWGRHPRVLEKKVQNIIDYSQRDILSIWVGAIDTGRQLEHRVSQDWSKCVQHYRMYNHGAHKSKRRLSQEEYLHMVGRSKFGLSLAGYGKKCNREPEYMGLGVVPIVAPEVDMNYYDSPEEGVHYFRVSCPEEVEQITSSISEAEWHRMSRNCIDWWHRNCSRKGSFDTTSRIIEENYDQSES